MAITRPRHLLSASQFSIEFLEELFDSADSYADQMGSRGPNGPNRQMLGKGPYQHYIMYSWFYEASTRTRVSFETAALRHGMQVIGTDNAGEFSSAAKGENLRDTILTLSSLNPDIIVIRHNKRGELAEMARYSSVPIINAGDKDGEHPTQALVDLFTIRREVGRLEDLSIVIGGDLKYGRTVRSLAQSLSLFDKIRIVFVSPPELRIGDDIRQTLDFAGIKFWEMDKLTPSLLQGADVLYWTRAQKERMSESEEPVLEPGFVIDEEVLQYLRRDAVIMHPLPRNDEISPDIDVDERAVYFKQSGYGVPVRMAVINLLLGGHDFNIGAFAPQLDEPKSIFRR